MRSVTGTGLVIAAIVTTFAALIFPIWSFSTAAGAGNGGLDAQNVSTRFGPLSALDRDFINRVRLAGLWELPAGQQAQERGTSKAVRRAGDHLVAGHTELDRRVREVAGQLGVELPSQPNEQQRQWLSRLSAAQGVAYDREFANILRLAHGKVFTLVAQVRANTRNTLVRQLASDTNATVLDHIVVLEKTGLVDFDAIASDAATASPPAPPNTPSTAAPSSAPSAPNAPTSVPKPAGPSPVSPSTSGPSPTYPLPPAATLAEKHGEAAAPTKK
ncbi:DUF4142 domain-containing protein [Streptomyces sp. H27-D2]|uniref:DUF4142 domain-containing protein n=1 Tax=Streptomyces sp. H27-D2 TaxID=3046304 RepID=UPI002DBC7731|nr:DUF4142 domain-containing protein [Streptomyces sp. H27-D2]MEC4019960.1 DUF4142 domain-containing protein [Streptomyces sp. H27-D2]